MNAAARRRRKTKKEHGARVGSHRLPTHGVRARARSPRQGHSGCELLAPQAGPTAPQASPPDIPAFLVVFCSLWAGFLAVFGPFENALRQSYFQKSDYIIQVTLIITIILC